MRQHLPRIADNEHCANRVAFAALATDLHGQIDDRFQRLQRYARLQLPQIPGGQPAQVLVQLNPLTGIVDGFRWAAIDTTMPSLPSSIWSATASS